MPPLLSVPCVRTRAMESTLDGERFELTPELVRARPSDEVPEDVREYWVDIDGVRRPVAQVISIATGVTNRRRFQSQDSRRWLQALGFRIGQGAAAMTGGRTPRSTQGPRQVFDASKLEPLGSIEVTSRFTWLRAGSLSLDGEGLPSFPPLPRGPGLYRFEFGLTTRAYARSTSESRFRYGIGRATIGTPRRQLPPAHQPSDPQGGRRTPQYRRSD